MTDQPFTSSALRGAVDLSGLAQRPAAGAAQAPATGPGAPGPATTGGGASPVGPGEGAPIATGDGLVVEVDDAQAFSSLVTASTRYPVVITLWARSQPGSRGPVDLLAQAVRAEAGRMQLGVVDIDRVPEIAQAFQQLGQAAQLPPGTPMTTVAFLQGQPMPLPPLPDLETARRLLEEIARIAVANGVAGRVPGDHTAPQPQDGAGEAELPPLVQEAYDAVERGDYDAATTAFEKAVAENPSDEEARLGLGQVRLLRRTQGVDLQQARQAAAQDPSDLDAALTVADLDVLGGHVEDAFSRLVDLVRATAGDERNRVREHLIGLFDIVGASDPRVKKARTALMSALY